MRKQTANAFRAARSEAEPKRKLKMEKEMSSISVSRHIRVTWNPDKAVVNGFELFSCMIVVRPLHAGFEFPIFPISPSRIVYRMQYAGQCELSRLPCINSSDVEDEVISGAKTVPLQMVYLSKRAANASEEYYSRALKHVSLMLIISACLIGWQKPVVVGGGGDDFGCKRMFQAFAHSGLGGWVPHGSLRSSTF